MFITVSSFRQFSDGSELPLSINEFGWYIIISIDTIIKFLLSFEIGSFLKKICKADNVPWPILILLIRSIAVDPEEGPFFLGLCLFCVRVVVVLGSKISENSVLQRTVQPMIVHHRNLHIA